MTITEQLKQLITDCGIPNRVIAQKAIVAEMTLSNIRKGGSVNCATAEAVANFFGKKFVLVDIEPEICEELVPNES